MVDIHCHALFGVDDGARTIAESIEMLKIAHGEHITDIILTPHYRKGMFTYPHDRIEANFEKMTREAERFEIRLHPGCEYHVDSDMVENFRSRYCMPLAGTDYVLAEFSTHSTLQDIRSGVDALLAAGFKPVIAHVERYEVIRQHPEELSGFRNSGALIQLNAGNILGEEGRQVKACCLRILKDGNADVVASDSHNTRSRRCRMKECRLFVAKKYGRTAAKALFSTNPKRILENG